MKSKTTGLVRRVRTWLQIDTWGWDLFRLKRRVGELEQRLQALENRELGLPF